VCPYGTPSPLGGGRGKAGARVLFYDEGKIAATPIQYKAIAEKAWYNR
jgi:hypothetical protein